MKTAFDEVRKVLKELWPTLWYGRFGLPVIIIFLLVGYFTNSFAMIVVCWLVLGFLLVSILVMIFMKLIVFPAMDKHTNAYRQRRQR